LPWIVGISDSKISLFSRDFRDGHLQVFIGVEIPVNWGIPDDGGMTTPDIPETIWDVCLR
jgi:hypothetical protein